jgi:hypothetical protein
MDGENAMIKAMRSAQSGKAMRAALIGNGLSFVVNSENGSPHTPGTQFVK